MTTHFRSSLPSPPALLSRGAQAGFPHGPWLLQLAFAWLIIACFCAPVRAQTGPGPTSAADRRAVVELTQAWFSTPATGAEQRVALPDTWAQRDLPSRGEGRYRLEFELATVPSQGWALRIDRLARLHEIRLNGQLLVGRLDAPSSDQVLSRPAPAWVDVPPSLLQVGTNRLEFRVRYSARGGLSTVWTGPSAQLRPASEWERLVDGQLPVALNAAGTALAMFMVLVWWRRRSEVLLGGFGLLWLLLSLRSTLEHYGHAAGFGIWFDALMFAGQSINALVLVYLALALAGRSGHVWWRLQVGLTTALVLLCLPALALDAIDALRTWGLPPLIASVVPPVFMAAPRLRRVGSRGRWLIVTALIALVGCAAHDHLAWAGTLSILSRQWMPLALPLVFSVFAWVLVGRMGRALSEIERLNADLEQRVADRTRALEHANQALNRFLAMASHDLRQPVVTIGLLVDLLRDRILEASQRRIIDRVSDAVASMEDLLRGLLDLSRIEAGAMRPRLEPVKLQDLFDAIAAHAAEAAQRKNLTLRLRPTALSVHSDRLLLEQVLRNLVGNALRYTSRGGVLVCARRRGRRVLLQVWDTGRGIAADQHERVFDEFVQGPPATDPPEQRTEATLDSSIGLGLAIVRRAVQLLAHPLQLRSVPGRGSCFSLWLDVDDAPAPAPMSRSASSPSLPGWRITVVNDDDAVRAALAARLVAWGAEVDGHASLASLRRHLAARPRGRGDIDVLVTREPLAGGSSVAVVDALRAHVGPVPALVICAGTPSAEAATLASRGVALLTEPFRPERLLTTLLGLGASAAPAAIDAGVPDRGD